MLNDFGVSSCSVSFLQWFRDGWSVFFALISAVIFVSLAAPALFGLQNFTQWGGMYDEHWCHADIYSSDPFDVKKPKPKQIRITAGAENRRVFSAPAHNQMSCAVWVRQFCGEKMKDGWTAAWVSPMLRGISFFEKQNACDITSLDSTDTWYFHAPKK